MSWESFYDFLRLPNENGQHRIVSVAPGVFLSDGQNKHVYAHLRSSGSELACILKQSNPSGGEIYIWTAAEQATAISSCDFLFELLAGADLPNALVMASSESDEVSTCPVSGHAIENYLTKSNNNLSSLHFQQCIMEEGHFRGFSNAPVREGVYIMLDECVINASVTASFLNCARKGRGPNYLWNCVIDPIALGQALTTSNHIKALDIGKLQWNEHSFRELVRALIDNKSLTLFNTLGMYISDHNCSVLCKSFRAHPTLLHLKFELNRLPHGVSNPQMPVERIERRMGNVLSMLHVNSVLEEVTLVADHSGVPPLPQNLLDKIETRLEMNCSEFEDQCQSLGPLAPEVRPKLLGRALHVVRYNPALLWDFLSEHLDVVVETADERIFSKLDAAAQKKRRQVDRHDAQKRAKRAGS